MENKSENRDEDLDKANQLGTARAVSGSFIFACASLLRGMYREVFGSFVPGAITVCFFIALPMLTYYVFTPACQIDHTAEIFRKISSGGSAFGYVIATLFVTFSYAIGSILYRRPLENADAVASFRQWAIMNTPDRIGLTVRFQDKAKPRGSPKGKDSGKSENRTCFIARALDGFFGKLLFIYARSIRSTNVVGWLVERVCEIALSLPYGVSRGDRILNHYGRGIKYPYPYLKKYLEKRGFKGLLKFVNWDPPASGSDDDLKLCSKNAINILKYRVRHYGTDDMVVEMDRNECHIRMLNSLWYSFRFIRFLAMFCSLLIGFAIIVNVAGICGAVSPSASSASVAALAVSTNQIFVSSNADTITENVSGNLPSRNSEHVNSDAAKKGEKERSKPFYANSGRLWALFIMGALFLGVTRCRRNIEMTFHYVRQREIIFILESADILYNKNKDYFKGVNVNEDAGGGKVVEQEQAQKVAWAFKRFFGAGGVKPPASDKPPSPNATR